MWRHIAQQLPILISVMAVLIRSSLSRMELTISPGSPIIAPLGSTVNIDCRLPNVNRPDLRWHLPWDTEVKDEVVITKGGDAKGRFIISWVKEDTLQLSITNLDTHDAGEYKCASGQPEYGAKAVKVWIQSPKNGTPPCSHTQFRCSTGQCIFQRYRCNKQADCPDGSDELGCDSSCEGKFQCDNGQCIDKQLACDKFHGEHCSDGSDEKYCDNLVQYTGKISPPGQSHDPGSETGQQSHAQWHFNAIYSGVAAIVGLLCVIMVIIITVCRIHMRRESMRHELVRHRHRNRQTRSRCLYPRNTSSSEDPHTMEDLLLPHRYPPTAKLAVNINLRFSASGMPELVGSPPPYTPGDLPPREGTPPPPYSTTDSRTRRRAEERRRMAEGLGHDETSFSLGQEERQQQPQPPPPPPQQQRNCATASEDHREPTCSREHVVSDAVAEQTGAPRLNDCNTNMPSSPECSVVVVISDDDDESSSDAVSLRQRCHDDHISNTEALLDERSSPVNVAAEDDTATETSNSDVSQQERTVSRSANVATNADPASESSQPDDSQATSSTCISMQGACDAHRYEC